MEGVSDIPGTLVVLEQLTTRRETVSQAKQFMGVADVTKGLSTTKLDGTTEKGIAVAISQELVFR